MSTRGQPYAWNASVYRTSFVFVPGLRFTSTDRGEIETTNWGMPRAGQCFFPPCALGERPLSALPASTKCPDSWIIPFHFAFFHFVPLSEPYAQRLYMYNLRTIVDKFGGEVISSWKGKFRFSRLKWSLDKLRLLRRNFWTKWRVVSEENWNYWNYR